MDNIFQDIDSLLKVNEEEAKAVMQEAQVRREQKKRATGASDGLTNRSLAAIPPSIYWGIARKHGRQIWNDPKFVKQFWETYKVFRACETY